MSELEEYFTTPDYTFQQWLESTAFLQEHYFDGDPLELTEDEAIPFITWNLLACHAEVSEALEEVSWKPWADSSYIRRDAIRGEIIDIMHFLGNILRAIDVGGTELTQWYQEKQRVNAARMEGEYDGQSGKCPVCHRDLQTDPHGFGCELDDI